VDFTNLDDKINKSKSRVGCLENLKDEEYSKLTKLRREKVRQLFGIQIGSIVEVKERTETKIGKITQIETGDFGRPKPWVKGFFKKKDGEFSKKEQHFYNNWELIKERK